MAQSVWAAGVGGHNRGLLPWMGPSCGHAVPRGSYPDGGTEEVLGFVAFDCSRDPKSKPEVGEIWALYVRPERVGTGVGLALWDAARDACEEEEFSEITAWTYVRNERALRFFGAAGFKREMKTLRNAPLGSTRLEEIRVRLKL